jgi:hypothetical protein
MSARIRNPADGLRIVRRRRSSLRPPSATSVTDKTAGAGGLFLLVPFLLGFSTNLVMAVLNRMISGVETMFGIERNASRQPLTK